MDMANKPCNNHDKADLNRHSPKVSASENTFPLFYLKINKSVNKMTTWNNG